MIVLLKACFFLIINTCMINNRPDQNWNSLSHKEIAIALNYKRVIMITWSFLYSDIKYDSRQSGRIPDAVSERRDIGQNILYTHSKFLLIFGQPIADYRKMQCGKVLLRISGKLSDQIFGTRIRLDRKYGARPAGRIPIPIGSISLEPDPYQIIRIRINYNKKAPINLEKNSQHVFLNINKYLLFRPVTFLDKPVKNV